MPNATTPAVDAPTETVDAELVVDDPKRTAWITGIRAICDFLEQHPEVPLPYIGGTPVKGGPTTSILRIYCQFAEWDGDQRGQRGVLADVARAMGHANKGIAPGDDFVVYRDFGGVTLVAQAQREEVCERVVVGSREVTEEIPDPEHVAAAPLVKQTRTEEIIEWRCAPVLAAALPAGGAS